jgi:exodeoxyribonuclease VII large subunit
VQGAGAAQEIAAAIHLLNDWAESNGGSKLDLILLTRGGGSLEDLWAFNEEIVARAIYGSRLPVVSAVGHEIDFTISDFVADFRAATPTAAAEIITEGVFSRRDYLLEAQGMLRALAQRGLDEKKYELEAMVRLLQRGHPKRKLLQQMQRLDELITGLNRCFRHHVRQKENSWKNVAFRLMRLRPREVLHARRESLIQLIDKLGSELKFSLAARHERVTSAEMRLRLLSPLNVLERGYSITLDAAGNVIRKADEVKGGDEIVSRLAQGKLRSVVKPQ